jgi:ketosteroid isomerase-like protein
MTPKELVKKWVQLFNQGNIDELVSLYAPGAINHQVVTEPLRGREAIRHMFQVEFGRATMNCLVENIFEDGDWAILEWRDPKGLRGCGSKSRTIKSSSSGDILINCRSFDSKVYL